MEFLSGVIFILCASFFFGDAQVTCNKPIALPGYKNVTLECTLTGTGNTNCSRKIFLWSSKDVFYIEPGERLVMGPLGLLEARCKASNSTVVADLQIYNVQDIHFTLTFTVKFNISNVIKEESLTLIKDDVSGSNSMQGTSILLCASLALIVKYFT